MASGPRHLASSFVSTGLRKEAQSLSAAEQAQVQTNLNVPAASNVPTVVGGTLTTPVIDGVTYSALNARQEITVAFAITGAALHAANLTALTLPADAVILRAVLDVTTKSTGAATVDVGYATASATTASSTLLSAVDVGTAAALFDSMNAALASGANAKAQKAATGKWITVHERADSTGMVATLYITFILA